MLWQFSSLRISSVLFGVSAAQSSEPTDFNVSHALIKQGVNASTIAELAALARQSSTCTCSVAVLHVSPSPPTCYYPDHRFLQCRALESIYGSEAVIFPNDTGSASAESPYWSLLQVEVEPRCTFVPSATSAVSVLVLLSRLTQCPFAVRSGGHAAFAGASNVAGGITVSMQNLNAIQLSEDRRTVSIQPGNTWSTVYTELAKSSLAVIGGRVAPIGIGGLTTGGNKRLSRKNQPHIPTVFYTDFPKVVYHFSPTYMGGRAIMWPATM